MSAQIKRYGLLRGSHGGRMSDELDALPIEAKPYVLHADHLAAMAAASAYDEASERKAAFEACPSGIDWGSYWQGWKACAKARAKAGGE
jgi:hypothetical protein